MQTFSVADAKAHLSEILNAVMAGEEVVITKRGKPIARIEAIKKKLKPLPDMKKIRSQYPAVKISSTQIIDELREEGY